MTKKSIAFASCIAAALSLNGAVCVWQGGATPYASDAENWLGSQKPAEGDSVEISSFGGVSHDCIYDIAAPLASFAVTEDYAGTLTIATVYGEEGFTALSANGDISILGGTVKHVSNIDETAKEKYRLRMTAAGNFTLGENAAIDLKALGFPKNPGVSAFDRGASHGGSMLNNPEKCYGSVKRPINTGSAGHYGKKECNGGGALFIEAGGVVTINGAVNADGSGNALGTLSGTYRSGSGGSIFIKGNTVQGTGSLHARGCQEFFSHSAGGGGRIAIHQTGASSSKDSIALDLSCAPSPGGFHAMPGTIYLEDAGDNGRGVLVVKDAIGAPAGLERTSLAAANQSELDEGFSKIILGQNTALGIEEGATLDISDTIVEADGANICLYGAISTGQNREWTGVRIRLLSESAAFSSPGTTTLGQGAILESSAYPATFNNLAIKNGGMATHAYGAGNSVNLIVEGNFTLEQGGTVDVTEKGENKDISKGFPLSGTQAGASHGGRGASKDPQLGDYTTPCFGSIYAPMDHAGGKYSGSSTYGAGAIKISVRGNATIDGVIAANGSKDHWLGGAGGSIILEAASLSGSGVISAIGAFSWNTHASGGGGRIAVTLTGAQSTMDSFTGSLIAFGSARQSNTTAINYTLPPSTAQYPVTSGAGSIYVREKGASAENGTLVFDQFGPAYLSESAFSEIGPQVEGREFGAVVVRNKAVLKILAGSAVTSSRWENRSKINFAPSASLALKGDGEGNAYLMGNNTIPDLSVLPSVRTLFVEALSTNRITEALAIGGGSESVQIRSTIPGTPFYFILEEGAAQQVSGADMADLDASMGAAMRAVNSSGSNVRNVEFSTVAAGETIYWHNSVDSNWGNVLNWMTEDGANRLPASTDSVIIQQGDFSPIAVRQPLSLASLEIREGASLALSGFPLTVRGEASIAGRLEATGDETVTFEGGLAVSGEIASSKAVVLSPSSPAALHLFDNASISSLLLPGGKTVSLSGSATLERLAVEPGANALFAEGSLFETAILAAGGSAMPASIAPAAGGASYSVTVSAYARAENLSVSGCDSSRGAAIYAQNCQDGGANQNWIFSDSRKVWLGSASSDMANLANWQNREAPLEGEDFVVAANASNPLAVTDGTAAFGSITVYGKGIQFNAPATLNGSLYLLGGTSEINCPVKLHSLVLDSDAVLTHKEQPKGEQQERYVLSVEASGIIYIGENALVDVSKKGFPSREGPGYAGKGSASYGGVGGQRYTPPVIAACYGSVFAPVNYGSGSWQGGRGGGAAILKANGATILDGSILACADQASCDSDGATGGSVFITSGSIQGKGTIEAAGQPGRNAYTGGGGRISIVLTKPGSAFSSFRADVSAKGGKLGTIGGGAGTVYFQTGDEKAGHGTIYLSNGSNELVNQKEYCLTGFGYPGGDDLRFATVVLGPSSGIYLFGDAAIGDLRITEEGGALRGKYINFNGHTLRIRKHAPRSRTLEGISGYFNGGYSSIKWLPGTMFIFR